MAKPIRQKDINLLSVIDTRQRRQALPKFVTACIAVTAASLVFAIALFAFGFFANTNLNSEINRINDYLNDPNTQAAISASNEMEAKLAAMNQEYEGLKIPISSINTHPLLRSNDIRTILNLAGSQVKIGVITFDVQTGLLEFTADIEGESVEGVPYYITQLRDSGVYADVTYRGYKETGVDNSGVLATPAAGAAANPDVTVPVVREGHDILSVQCLVKTDASKLAAEQEAAKIAAEKKAAAKKKKAKK